MKPHANRKEGENYLHEYKTDGCRLLTGCNKGGAFEWSSGERKKKDNAKSKLFSFKLFFLSSKQNTKLENLIVLVSLK